MRSRYRQYQREYERGFTLLELLVVIAIIGVLASITLASLSSARANARDASRVATMAEVRKGMEQHFYEYGWYPNGHLDSGGCIDLGAVDQTAIPGSGDPVFSGTLAETQRCTDFSRYYPAEPKDPLGVPTTEYGYVRLINPEGYATLIFMENTGAFCESGVNKTTSIFSVPDC